MMKRFIWLFCLILLIVPTFVTLIRPGIHNMQDSMQYFRIYEMNKCFIDKQIPCRWVPDMGYGYGYPLFIYYSPGPFYLGTFIHQFGVSYIDTVKVLFIAGFLFSAIGMFLFLKEIFNKNLTAFFGVLLYIYVPVRAVQVYVRGSLGEFLAMSIFPWMCLFTYRIIRKNGLLNVLFLALSLAGLLLTHNLMCLAFLPFWGLWTGITVLFNRSWANAVKILLGVLLGIGLAAFYVVPLIFERNYVHLESMIGGYFDYRQHFVTLHQLFISNHWGYGSSVLGPNDDISLSVGIVQWIMAAMAGVVAFINLKRDKNQSIEILMIFIIGVFYIFLMHQKSSFIWNHFGFMSLFQFPWRMLPVTSFLLIWLSAYTINNFVGIKKKIIFVLGLVGVFLLYGSNFTPQKWLNVDDKALLSGKEFVKQQTASIFDYLPKSAFLPPNSPAPFLPIIIKGDGTALNFTKGSDFQVGDIQVESQSALIRAPMFDFPGVKVWDNNKVIGHEHVCDGQPYCFGQVSFFLNKGNHNVLIRLTNTWPRTAGDIISICGAIIFIIFFTKKKSWWS